MKAYPYMPFYVQDWFSDPEVQSLTYEEQGIYITLLGRLWESDDATLPDDDAYLSRILRLTSRKWARVRAVLIDGPTAVLHTVDGRLTQKRLREEFFKARHVSERRAEAGKRGGDAKAYNRAIAAQRLTRKRLAIAKQNSDVAIAKRSYTDTNTEAKASADPDPDARARVTAADDLVLEASDPKPGSSPLPDTFDAAEVWAAQQLGKLHLSSGDWPTLKAQLAAVDDDLSTFQRLITYGVEKHQGRIGSLRYFDQIFGDWTKTHTLPTGSRASPQDDGTTEALRQSAAYANDVRRTAHAAAD